MKLIKQEKASVPAIYRHFAVVTVALTVLLAIFANGENRDALAAQATPSRSASSSEKKPALVDKTDGPKDTGAGSWGQESDPAFSRLAGSGTVRNIPTSAPQQVPAAYRANIVSEDVLATLSPEDREKFLREYSAANAASKAAASSSQMAAIEAASADRAGAASE